MTGFGQVHPLPGIWPSFHLNTAVTLPVGVEAYAAYALRAARDGPGGAGSLPVWLSERCAITHHGNCDRR
jgi:hypothetical protein